MPTSNTSATAVDLGLSDEQVREYLKLHDDFLQRNPDMLDYLHISHASGSAVSLVEKQVGVLRERNIDMRHRLSTLTSNARENDRLYDLTRALVLKLLEANSISNLYRIFMNSMRDDFEVEQASMVLFGDANEHPSRGDCRVESLERAKIEVGSLLRGRKPLCGALRQDELNYLFPHAGAVGSAALMPLINGGELGLIAVGSSDASRYSTDMGTLFLSHIADVMIRILPRLWTVEQ